MPKKKTSNPFLEIDDGGYSIMGLKTFPTDDGGAFHFTLCLNGKKVLTVQNGGYGGPNEYHAIMPKGTSAEVWGKAQRERVTTLTDHAKKALNDDGFEIKDTFICHLLDAYENDKRFKRMCKTQVLFRIKGDKKGEYRSYKRKFTPAFKERMLAHLDKQGYKVIEILNERYA